MAHIMNKQKPIVVLNLGNPSERSKGVFGQILKSVLTVVNIFDLRNSAFEKLTGVISQGRLRE